MKTFQELESHLAGPEVEISSRFVGQQNGGLAHQSARQDDALLFSAR